MQHKNHSYNDKTHIAYSIAGAGEPLVLLHGFGANRYCWEEYGWVSNLSKSYTVIAIDTRGLGESSISYDSQFYHMDLILEDIKRVVNECGFTYFSVFGHSYGGTIALRAIKSGMNVKKAIIASGTWDAEFFRIDVSGWIDYYSKMNVKKKKNELRGIEEEELAWLKQTDLDNYLAQFRAWTTLESVDIEEIGIPMFIYSGTEDESRTIQFIKENKRVFLDKNWKYKIYEGMNHSDLVKRESEIIPDVLEFLELF